MYRYYLTQRPLGPGTFPKGVKNIDDYAYKQYAKEIGRFAWGWVEYEKPLSNFLIVNYELTEVKPK